MLRNEIQQRRSAVVLGEHQLKVILLVRVGDGAAAHEHSPQESSAFLVAAADRFPAYRAEIPEPLRDILPAAAYLQSIKRAGILHQPHYSGADIREYRPYQLRGGVHQVDVFGLYQRSALVHAGSVHYAVEHCFRLLRGKLPDIA